MPSTRLMPVVMMSSLQVWSRLARDILFSPMSVQYTVSFPVRHIISLKGREKWHDAAAAKKYVFMPSNKAAHENTFFTAAWPFSPDVVWHYKAWWWKYPQLKNTSMLTHSAWAGKVIVGQILQGSILLHEKHSAGKSVIDSFLILQLYYVSIQNSIPFF